VVCLNYIAWALWLLGYPDQAVRNAEESIEIARNLNHPNSLAISNFVLNLIRSFRREAVLVQEGAENLIAFSAEHGLGLWLLWSPIHRDWAMALQGRDGEWVPQMREALVAAHAVGADIGRTNLLCQIAEACCAAGQFDEALITLDEALAVVEKGSEFYYESEIHRLKGELLLKKNRANAVQAQSCFERAIAIARGQRGKSLELSATTSLAQLLAKHGEREKACAMLAEIYDWFTEGFDTAPLKEAKALLDELSEPPPPRSKRSRKIQRDLR
jgi:predicted ATPase